MSFQYALRFPERCSEEVSRNGEAQPCEKTAVALRDGEGDGPYPVCAFHTRQPCVPLSALIAEIRWSSQPAPHDHEFEEQCVICGVSAHEAYGVST